MKTVLFVFLLALSAQKVFANESQCLDQVANYFGIDNSNLNNLSSMNYNQLVNQAKIYCQQNSAPVARLVSDGTCRARTIDYIFVCWLNFHSRECNQSAGCYWDY